MLDRHLGKEHGRQWNGSCNKHTRYKMKPDKNKSCLPCVAEKETTRPSKRKTHWLGLGLALTAPPEIHVYDSGKLAS